MNEDDKRLKKLRNEWGEMIYEVVIDALLEMEEYNPSGRYVVPKLWNFEEDKKASLKEAIKHLISERSMQQVDPSTYQADVYSKKKTNGNVKPFSSQVELKNERRRVCSLLYEIDRRKQQSFEMELKYNKTIATLQGHVDGLVVKINSKDNCLWDWELRYNETVRQLKGENTALRRGTMTDMSSFDVTRFASRALIDLRVLFSV
ncbi:factor of DNA methylation 4-like isoform X2 [Gossypium australe]|uniref:Factor of DNA methylation 4-like isoform X2 n=1 Tax=Gossypium australe TaxID=47621 RepID=A0A5B6WKY2_9ROSI|nr:factor of DNA methylation 4-like isoform X2 [Gossypium australe]